MAGIKVFQGGAVQQQGPTDARHRAADFGPGALAVGLKGLGEGLNDATEKLDEIEDINAKIEANQLLTEHSKAAQLIDERVTQTLGMDAEAAADQGVADLNKIGQELTGRASPRAKLLLETELANRSLIRRDRWTTHGFNEKRGAFEASSVAANSEDIDAAIRLGDDEAAKPLLGSVVARNQERADFFGWDANQLQAQNRKDVSTYFTKRARLMATNGSQASAAAAVDYAMKNRQYMTDEDFQSVLSSYNGAAVEELTTQEALGNLLPSSQVTAAPDPLAPLPEGQPAPTRALDPVAFFKTWIVSPNAEGTALAIDNNGAQVRYGFNIAFNPHLKGKLERMTLDQGAQEFASNHWKRSGAERLPPALAAVHMDTFYLNEKQAGRILKESGGDVQRYFELRREFLNGLARKNPAKYPGAVWERRTKALEQYATRLGGDGTFPSIPVSPSTNMTEVENAIMARKDVGLGYKRALVNAYRERRNALRTEVEIGRAEASDALTRQLVKLGDNFTSLTQLDPEQLAKADPSVVKSLQDAARASREKKTTQELTPYIDTVEMTDPNKFLSNDFIIELKKKGAPADFINQVVSRQNTKRAAILGQKPDPVGSTELWTIAKGAFEQSGLYFDTLEGKNEKAKAEERLADDAKKQQAVGFLRNQAVAWAQNNPGKRPTEEEMRKWVGVALIQTQTGQRFFEMNDYQLVGNISTADRQNIIRRLKAAGIHNPSVPEIAAYYRELKIKRGN